uniref:Uncharacterized protein n=1 Tax=Solanum lycopersicum TaxID=4081 RepID=A0A3Q7GU25_SOLLC
MDRKRRLNELLGITSHSSAKKQENPPIKDVFTDVYDVFPANLQEQEISIRETIRRHPLIILLMFPSS